MSNRPQGFAFLTPTGGSLPGAFFLYHEYSPSSSTLSPNENRVVVAARHAYSHSASDGSRIVSFSPISLRVRSFMVTRVQNSVSSAQLTISTELRGPCHLAGLLPMTTWYSSWVTSY